MIEILSLIEPLIGQVSITVSNEGGVDWEDVLLSPNILHVFLNSWECILIVLLNGKWMPSLTDFRVRIQSNIQIFIDLRHYLV